jgi:hypothetical protein
MTKILEAEVADMEKKTAAQDAAFKKFIKKDNKS